MYTRGSLGGCTCTFHTSHSSATCAASERMLGGPPTVPDPVPTQVIQPDEPSCAVSRQVQSAWLILLLLPPQVTPRALVQDVLHGNSAVPSQASAVPSAPAARAQPRYGARHALPEFDFSKLTAGADSEGDTYGEEGSLAVRRVTRGMYGERCTDLVLSRQSPKLIPSFCASSESDCHANRHQSGCAPPSDSTGTQGGRCCGPCAAPGVAWP